MDAGVLDTTNGTLAYGEVAWSRRPDAGVKLEGDASHHTGDGGNRAGLPEESAI